MTQTQTRRHVALAFRNAIDRGVLSNDRYSLMFWRDFQYMYTETFDVATDTAHRPLRICVNGERLTLYPQTTQHRDFFKRRDSRDYIIVCCDILDE